MDGILTAPQAIGGPELLDEKRKAAWEEYRSLPMPTRKSEEWRYTDLTKLDPERFERIEAGDPTAEPMASDDLPGVVREILTDESKRSGTLVEIDATVVRLELAPEAADAGVVFAPIARIVEQRPDLIERFLFASDIVPYAISNRHASVHGSHAPAFSDAHDHLKSCRHGCPGMG